MAPFTGFTTDMFDVYVPERWSSHVHNLPRMRNKDAMVALCDAACAGLEGELEGLSRATSDEIPSIVNLKRVEAQWAYWFRDQLARESLASFLEKTPLVQNAIFNIAPQDKHVTLAVIMRHQGIWIGLRVAHGAVVDRRNLATKLAASWEREHVVALLHELPEGTTMGFEDSEISAHEVTLDTLANFAEQLADNPAAWRVGVSITRDEAASLGLSLVDDVRRWLGVFAPMYRFTAWTRDNDMIEANKQIQEEKAQKRRHATAYNPGDKVRFTAGFFSGKSGVVQEIDAKAKVKVLVGKMSVLVPGSDLTPAR